MFCYKCGNEVLDGAGFCSKCGAPVQGNVTSNLVQGTEKIMLESNKPTSPKLQLYSAELNKKIGIVIIVGLVVFIISQVYLMNAATDEMRSQWKFLELDDGTIITEDDYLKGKIPIDIRDSEEFEMRMSEANWGFYALKPEQIHDKRGWDWPQDLWISLFGKDHTNDDDLYRLMEIGRGVKIPVIEFRRWMGVGHTEADAGNKYVSMVKDSYRENNPHLTYDKAFLDFFGMSRWKYFEDDDGQDIVEFSGDCTYQDVVVKARIQFVVNKEAGIFEPVYLAFNEVPQNSITLDTLIQTVFEGTEQEENLGTKDLTEDEAIRVAQQWIDAHPLYKRTIIGVIELSTKAYDTTGLYCINVVTDEGDSRTMWVSKEAGEVFISPDGTELLSGEEFYKVMYPSADSAVAIPIPSSEPVTAD